MGEQFTNLQVRSFAVIQLRKVEDEELQLYLLQLVQALKFENLEKYSDSPLVEFLIERGIDNPVLGNYFHWYLMVECQDKVMGKLNAKIAYRFITSMIKTSDGLLRRGILKRQGELIATLAKLSKDLRASNFTRPKKIDILQKYIADPRNGLLSFEPLPLPLDPSIFVTGIIPESAKMFKSALLPLHLSFTCLDGSVYQLIFKTGDDLRQDQLIVQIITLMDRLLRNENMDLKLTPYKVLATGIDHG